MALSSEFKGLANRTAVIGVGNTAYGSFPELDEYGLAARAFRSALEDGGIDKSEVDGLVVCRIPYYARMGEVLGLDPRWSLTLPPHGRMSGVGLIEAAMAIATRSGEDGGAALQQYRPVAARELRRRGDGLDLGPLGLHLAGRRPMP